MDFVITHSESIVVATPEQLRDPGYKRIRPSYAFLVCAPDMISESVLHVVG